MALNLSTLTSPATSGDVLAEILTTANFLGAVPLLRNLSTGSNKGGSAKQDVALNQPKALPLDANGKGYLYLSGVSGNYADIPVFDMGALDDFTIQIDGLDAGSVRPAATVTPISYFGSANVNRSFILQISTTGQIKLYLYLNGVAGHTYNDSTAVPTNAIGIRVTRVGTVLTYWVDTGSGYVSHDTDTVPTTPLYNPSSLVSVNVGQYSGGDRLIGKIGRAVIWNNGTQAGTPVLDVDFSDSKIPHGASKFKCVTGQVVTINQAGNDPATVIKKSVLRFDGTDDFMNGLLNQTVTDGYMFAAFSVLGDGGESFGRIFGMNSTGAADNAAGGFAIYRNSTSKNYRTNYNGIASSFGDGLFDDEIGDVLIESSFKNSSQINKVNNADKDNGTGTLSGVLSSEEFKIASFSNGGFNAAIDLEYLALFDASITNAQADSVRNYINTRNLVFDLKDGFGYYFFDATKAPVGAISSGANAWNGRIVGSDNGDIDKLATQETSNDAPVGDGFKVTFADNSDHLDIPSTTQAGWQICGTSLGTFVSRVDSDAVTELNLLGNLGNAGFRLPGELYGTLLLPESATQADLNAARKLLIDRGANEQANGAGSIYYAAWYQRRDIVEFQPQTFPRATNMGYGWSTNLSLTTFGAVQAPVCINFSQAWNNTPLLTSFPSGAKLGTAASNVDFSAAWQDSGLTSFPALDLSKGNNFSNTWRTCSALTSFPAGAKLGTAASNVNFTSAWRSSGLTSFPALDLSTGNDFKNTFYLCSNLTEISADAKFGTAAVNVDFDSAFASTGLTSFPSLDLSTGTKFLATWFGNNSLIEFGAIDARLGNTFADAFKNCSALTSFPSGANLGTEASNVVFSETWRSSGLTSFSTPLNNGNYFFRAWRDCNALVDFSANVFANWNPTSITSGVFDIAWDGCSSLSAVSVGNILTSIAASGQFATVDGNSGSAAIADAGIDIDYNTATGSLSAATNSAVTSLKSKGWSIIVNNVTL